MRYLVISVVGAVHVVAIGGLMLMQGCGTTRGPVELQSNYEMPPPVAQDQLLPPEPVVEPYRPASIEQAVASATPKHTKTPTVKPTLKPTVKPTAKPVKVTPVDVGSSYVVGKGDSLSMIAKRHRVSVADIMVLNNISQPNKIRLGQKLKMPANATKPTAATAFNPAVVKTAAVATVSPDSGSGSVYVVKSGDILSRIANRQGTTVKALREANNLKDDKLVVGQKLTLPSGNSGQPASKPEAIPANASPAAAPAPVAEPVVPPAMLDLPGLTAPSAPVSSGARNTYTVQAGDSILDIASQFNVGIADLLRVNNLTSQTLAPGQVLMIP